MSLNSPHLSRKDEATQNEIDGIAAAAITLLPQMLAAKYGNRLTKSCKADAYLLLVREGVLGGSHRKARFIAKSIKQGNKLSFSDIHIYVSAIDKAIASLVDSNVIDIVTKDVFSISLAKSKSPVDTDIFGDKLTPFDLYSVNGLTSHQLSRLKINPTYE